MPVKSEIQRPYAPDYLSIETLAYRLDCSPSTVRDYVDRGLLPRPTEIGNLVRWRWSDIETHIEVRFGAARVGAADDGLDEFSRAVLRNGKTS